MTVTARRKPPGANVAEHARKLVQIASTDLDGHAGPLATTHHAQGVLHALSGHDRARLVARLALSCAVLADRLRQSGATDVELDELMGAGTFLDLLNGT